MFFFHIVKSLFKHVLFALKLGNPLHLKYIEVSSFFKILNHDLVEFIFNIDFGLFVVQKFLLEQLIS